MPLTTHLIIASLTFALLSGARAKTIEAITFATEPRKIYVPLKEAEKILGLRTLAEDKRKALRQFTDGTKLITLTALLTRPSVTVHRDISGQRARVRRRLRGFNVVVGSKRAVVSLGEQRLRAWQGERLVLDTNISSGRRGSTPPGNFTAGPYKARRHYSSRYDNAPMPWSVQINGHIFIHGFTSVPDHPASHGCIRVPLNKGNPARFFYEWIDRGTSVRVTQP